MQYNHIARALYIAARYYRVVLSADPLQVAARRRRERSRTRHEPNTRTAEHMVARLSQPDHVGRNLQG